MKSEAPTHSATTLRASAPWNSYHDSKGQVRYRVMLEVTTGMGLSWSYWVSLVEAEPMLRMEYTLGGATVSRTWVKLSQDRVYDRVAMPVPSEQLQAVLQARGVNVLQADFACHEASVQLHPALSWLVGAAEEIEETVAGARKPLRNWNSLSFWARDFTLRIPSV